MNVAGIIAEYNPFHKGHELHIEETRKKTDCDHIIIVMSGDFTQRGIPAVMPKHERAAIALSCGADLVLELPANYATGTAERFAYGAVSLLHHLHCVDTLSFGSESGNLTELKAIADFLCAPTEEFTALIDRHIAQGHSYPHARQKALSSMLDEAVLLSDSNNILAVEYLKALRRLESSITPITIKRNGSQYNDETLTPECLPSAMALRKLLADISRGDSVIPPISSAADDENACGPLLLEHISPFIPAPALPVMESSFGVSCPVFLDDFSSMLHYKLLSEQQFDHYQDVDPDLSDRILRLRDSFTTVTSFTELLKTKNVTYSRVARALLHILLEMKNAPVLPCPYARMLGFKKESTDLLSAIKQNSGIPLITKLADADHTLDGSALSMLQEDIHASDIYHAAIAQKYGTHLPNEYRTVIPIV